MSETIVAYQSFVGVDLHKNTVTLANVKPDGTLIDRVKIPTKCRDRIASWLLIQPRPSHLAVEAVGFVEWFIDDYRGCVDRIDIADATELANRRGKRRHNDPNDAADVAKRLARGECPLGYIADDELMQLRKLGRHWHQLSRLLTRTKHAMRSMLLAANIAGPKLDGPAAQKWLLAHGHLLKPVQQQAFANFLDIIQLVERQRARLHLQITFANRAKRFVKTVDLLKSVPGIDEIWGCIIAAEIGPFDRFPNADALEFWAGMTSDLKESAGRTQPGPITKAGSRSLRWALCKAAITLCRSDKKQEAIRQRLIRRIGKPKANVAMGRRLLRTLYAMIRDEKPFTRGPATKHNLGANRARMARKQRKEFARAY
jgi:transposase